jgi:hypothetical protein
MLCANRSNKRITNPTATDTPSRVASAGQIADTATTHCIMMEVTDVDNADESVVIASLTVVGSTHSPDRLVAATSKPIAANKT